MKKTRDYKGGERTSTRIKRGEVTSKLKLVNKAIDTSGFTTSNSEMMNQKEIPRVRLNNMKSMDRDQGIKSWYLMSEDKIGPAIAEVVWRIDQQLAQKRNHWIQYARKYGNYDTMGWATSSTLHNQIDQLVSFNITQSCIDTLNSKVAKDNPIPYLITEGADYMKRVKAEHGSKYIQAAFTYMKLYEKSNNNVFRDAALFGLGGLKFFIADDKPQCEWVFINEIKVDDYDGMKQEPRSMHQAKVMQREKALGLFDEPEQQKIIMSSSPNLPQNYSQAKYSTVNLVTITESWHLPSYPGADDGVHVFTCMDKVLFYEPYEKDYFPFIFMRYYLKALGFYGRSVSEQIKDGQREIDKMLRKIKHALETAAVPFFIAPTNCNIAEEVILNNEMTRLIPYDSAAGKPELVSPTALSAEVYQHLDKWINWCYQEVGITQTSASGMKQQGVNSAVAMRTMVDMESSRFLQVAKNWNQFYIDCALMVLRMCNQLQEDDPEIDLTFPYFDTKNDRNTRTYAYKDVQMSEDEYTIKCDLTSGFPGTIAGKFQTITDFIQNNYLSKERGMEMLELGDPDLQREMQLQTATLRLCEKRLCEMVEMDMPAQPDPYMNLVLAKQVSQSTYVLLQSQNCPDEKLNLVRDWIDAICNLLSMPQGNQQMLQSSYGTTPQLGPGQQMPPQLPAAAPGQPAPPPSTPTG